MKFITKLLGGAAAAVGLAAIAAPAQAEVYVAAGANQTSTQTQGYQFDGRTGYDAAVGVSGGALRLEAGYSHFAGDALSVVHSDADYFNGTAYLDAHLGGLTLSAGVGGGYLQGEDTVGGAQVGHPNNGWDYHWTAQAGVDLSDRVALVASYREIPQADIRGVGLALKVKIA